MRPRSPHLLLLTVCLVPAVGLFAAIPVAAQDDYFNGELSHRGDTLEVRLRVDEAQNNAWLDLPELWYADEPIPIAKVGADTIRLSLPFGVGELDLQAGGAGYAGGREGFGFVLEPGEPPPYTSQTVRFGAFEPHVEGTLVLPAGDGLVPAVVLVGGAANSDRSSWGYRSLADWYARRGIAALAYDRRPWDQEFEHGRMVDFWSNADDLAAARDTLAAHPRIDPQAIGAHAGSQGVWITLIAQDTHGSFSWLVFTGAPAVTPAEQQIQSLVQGMRDDGLPKQAIADALAYQRLYFAVAHRNQGWEALEQAITDLPGTAWGEYVDQPRGPEDLAWWRRHMNFEPGPALSRLDVPVLVMNGSRDWVVPAWLNLPLFEHYARQAGNEQVTMLTLENADHRLETPPGEDASGQWRFFRIHLEARKAIERFLDEFVR